MQGLGEFVLTRTKDIWLIAIDAFEAETTNDTNNENRSSAAIVWLSYLAVLLLSLSIGLALGFAIGDRQGKSAKNQEVVAALADSQRVSAEHKELAKDSLARLTTERTAREKEQRDYESQSTATKRQLSELLASIAAWKLAYGELKSKQAVADKPADKTVSENRTIRFDSKSKPEDYTPLLPSLDGAKTCVKNFGVDLEKAASLYKLMGDIELGEKFDRSKATDTEIRKRVSAFEARKQMGIVAAEFMARNDSAKRVWFFSACYSLERALIDVRANPKFDFEKLPPASQIDILALLKLFKGHVLFCGLHDNDADLLLGIWGR